MNGKISALSNNPDTITIVMPPAKVISVEPVNLKVAIYEGAAIPIYGQPDLSMASDIVRFDPLLGNVQFLAPLELRMFFFQNLDRPQPERTVRLYYFDYGSRLWRRLGGEVDPDRFLVRYRIQSFATFAVLHNAVPEESATWAAPLEPEPWGDEIYIGIILGGVGGITLVICVYCKYTKWRKRQRIEGRVKKNQDDSEVADAVETSPKKQLPTLARRQEVAEVAGRKAESPPAPNGGRQAKGVSFQQILKDAEGPDMQQVHDEAAKRQEGWRKLIKAQMEPEKPAPSPSPGLYHFGKDDTPTPLPTAAVYGLTPQEAAYDHAARRAMQQYASQYALERVEEPLPPAPTPDWVTRPPAAQGETESMWVPIDPSSGKPVHGGGKGHATGTATDSSSWFGGVISSITHLVAPPPKPAPRVNLRTVEEDDPQRVVGAEVGFNQDTAEAAVERTPRTDPHLPVMPDYVDTESAFISGL